MLSSVSFGSRAYFPGDSNPKNTPVEYERILSQAESPDVVGVGKYTISRNPEKGHIEVSRKKPYGLLRHRIQSGWQRH